MKKIKIHFSVLALLLFAASLPAFAQEDKAAQTTDGTLASIDRQNQETISEEVQKADPDTFDLEGSEVAGVKTRPTTTTKKSTTRPVTSKVRSSQMKKNWDAIFSKKPASDSQIYTVKPGDSLYVIAKKNHTTVDLIKKINGLKGDVIFPDQRLKLFTGTFSVKISTSQNTLTLFADGKPIKRYSISSGANDSTPLGKFKIVNKLENPTWFKTGAIYPPDSPENALGTRWLGFDLSGYGIHGTIEPGKIGRSVSLGCIRMLNKDVEELYGIVPTGTKVNVAG